MDPAPTFRVLRPGDEATLDAFLRPLADSSMILRANAATAGLEDRGQFRQGTYLGAFEGERLVAVVARYWQGNLSLQAPRHLAALLRELSRLPPRPVAGLIGPAEQVAEARALLGMERTPAKLEAREALFALDLRDLRPPDALLRGTWRLRVAAPADLPVLARFRHDFDVEALGDVAGEEILSRAREAVAGSAADGSLFALEHEGQVVSTSAFSARLPDIVQVGGVYTPPAWRGRGYGRGVVAGSLLLAREAGATRSVLIAREEGPARRAYESIGYRAIGDYGLVLFR